MNTKNHIHICLYIHISENLISISTKFTSHVKIICYKTDPTRWNIQLNIHMRKNVFLSKHSSALINLDVTHVRLVWR